MRWHLLLVGGGLSLLVLDVGLAQYPPSVPAGNPPAYDPAAAAQRRMAPPESPPLGQSMPRADGAQSTVRFGSSPAYQMAADPFQYRTPEGGDASVPVDIDLPPGIRVLGILMMGSGYSLTAIQLPGEPEIYYVSEDDELLVRGDLGPARAPRSASTPAPRSPGASGSGAFYLKIKSITPQHVEVHPARRPDNIQILR